MELPLNVLCPLIISTIWLVFFSSFTQAIFDQYYAQIDSTCIEKARSQIPENEITVET